MEVPPGLEPRTFCVLSRRDNHYTTEPMDYPFGTVNLIKQTRDCTNVSNVSQIRYHQLARFVANCFLIILQRLPVYTKR